MDRVSWYVLRRLMVLFIGLMVILTSEFIILHVAPGDPAGLAIPRNPSFYDPEYLQEVNAVFNEPLTVQYVEFIGDMFTGDFGYSWIMGTDVGDFIYDAAWRTLTVFLGTLSVCLLIGTIGGYLIFRMRSHASRQAMSIVPLALFSVPASLSAYLLIRYLYYEWGLVPNPIGDTSASFLIATATASITLLGAFILIVRDGLMVASVASGPDPPRLRDALFAAMPKIQFMAAGSMLFVVTIEVMFPRPGIGYYFVSSLFNVDYFLVQSTFFFMIIMVFFTNYAMETLVTLVRLGRRLDTCLREDAPEARAVPQTLPGSHASETGVVKNALIGISRDYFRSPIGVVSLIVLLGFIVLAVVGPALTSDEIVYPLGRSSTDRFLDGATALVAVSFIVGILASVAGAAFGLFAGLNKPYDDSVVAAVVAAVMQGLMAVPIVCFVTLSVLTARFASDYGYMDAARSIFLPVAVLVALLVWHGVVSSRKRVAPPVGGPVRHAPAVLSSTLNGLKYGMPMVVLAVFACDFIGLTPFNSWGRAFDMALVFGLYEGSSAWEWLLPSLATSFLVGSMYLVLDALERVVRTRFAAHL